MVDTKTVTARFSDSEVINASYPVSAGKPFCKIKFVCTINNGSSPQVLKYVGDGVSPGILTMTTDETIEVDAAYIVATPEPLSYTICSNTSFPVTDLNNIEVDALNNIKVIDPSQNSSCTITIVEEE